MNKHRFAILANEDKKNTAKWTRACERFNQNYIIIDMIDDNWIDNIHNYQPECCLIMPSVNLSYYKKMYDEKLYILSEVLNYFIYPSYVECIIYENKRLLSYYLKAHKIPHPKTYVFYDREKAQIFAANTKYPIVGKMNLGSSGAGIDILDNRNSVNNYIKKAFSKKGLKRRFGPNKKVGNPKQWTKKALRSPQFFINKIKSYIKDYNNNQKHFVIFQEYIPHEYEWRAVKIDGSFFAHKKLKVGNKASGTKEKIYDNPPLTLLNFARQLCEKYNYTSMSMDIFEDQEGNYLVNELQTIFGQSDKFQMLVDREPGRYVFQDGDWIFEKGYFNRNECFDLRLQHAINILEGNR